MIFQRKSQLVALAALAVAICAGDAIAQPGGGGRGGRGGGFGQESSLGLLGQEGIRSDLELLDDQVKEIEELQTEMREQMRTMFMEMRDEFQGADRNAAWSKMQEKMTEINKDYDGKTKEILLPHQWTRLSQIRVQAETRRSGGAAGGQLPATVIEELKITPDQIEKMKAKAEEVRKTMDEKIAKIRQQAEEEILSVLSADQREQYKEMIGDTYTFQNGGRFGGGPGGPGGPGQGGPGGRGGRGGAAPGAGGGTPNDF